MVSKKPGEQMGEPGQFEDLQTTLAGGSRTVKTVLQRLATL